MKAFLPPLTQQEEKEYVTRMKGGSLEARHVLVERNMRLVAHIVKKYQNVDEETEELISIGTIGLIKAVATFNDERGSRLATYAARCIDNELLMYLRSKRKSAKEVSLYEPVGTDKEGNQIRLLDICECEDPDVVEELDLRWRIKTLHELIPQLLSGRELQIIEMRYGLNQTAPLTQREIAKKVGISRSYVSRIEKRALQRLREGFAGREDAFGQRIEKP
ncbi:MAG: RNA polymerase sporulation sigma factor SigK [bacterium]|nr:RNA polymerase sporulation sigma factor SigK [bacterium]MDY4100764.1 RNA polymerase sporulation sigma factor SigK [Lachnospiraceae bacterium]